ncbi:hypothetical protein [Bacteroides zoogleoformans]|uniref:hypothetical protein n=1 Tax=Bacteroides zoogleoformans TaxID=28119 RepID=UPI00248F26A8|nr:hypothetical protein [Bacteroides zoogleoformans]
MKAVNALFRYIGYATVSVVIGVISYLGGQEYDYLLKISGNLVPLLLSLLVFYVTMFGYILKELICYKNNIEANVDISGILKNIKLQISIEIGLIIASLLCFIIRGACETSVPNVIMKYIAIISNAITVFSIIYFLLAIYDSILGLWKLIEANNNNKN